MLPVLALLVCASDSDCGMGMEVSGCGGRGGLSLSGTGRGSCGRGCPGRSSRGELVGSLHDSSSSESNTPSAVVDGQSSVQTGAFDSLGDASLWLLLLLW